MKKCLNCLALALSLIVFSSANGDVVDFLDFSNDGDGVVHNSTPDFPIPNSPVAGGTAPNDWLLTYDPLNVQSDTTLNEFQAIGGILRVQDWGGVGTLTGTWTATRDGTIDIVGTGVTIGNAPFNGTVNNGPGNTVTEGITWFYQINAEPVVEVVLDRVALTGDAGTAVPVGTSVDNLFDDIEVSTGDVVSYGFSVAVNGAGDGVEISSVEIDLAAVPEPGSMLVLGLGMIGLLAQRRRS